MNLEKGIYMNLSNWIVDFGGGKVLSHPRGDTIDVRVLGDLANAHQWHYKKDAEEVARECPGSQVIRAASYSLLVNK